MLTVCCTLLQAPFRFARVTILGGLAAGAGLGLLIIIGRLIQSIKGGPGAPPLEVRVSCCVHVAVCMLLCACVVLLAPNCLLCAGPRSQV